MRYDRFELSVAVPSNRGLTKIPEYGHKGLTFVEGRRGQHYSLKLRNDTAGRVLAVISVDGINVLTGEACTPESRGYVIPAYSTVDVNGWRTSLSEVRNFYFTDRSVSYNQGAGGEVQNCGVIAAKFFSEKPAPPPAWIIQEHHHHHHHDHYEPVWPPYWPKYPKWPYPDIVWTTAGGSTAGQQWGSGTSQQYSCCIGQQGNVGSQGAPGVNAVFMAQTELDQTIKCALSSSDVPDFKLGTGWGGAKEDQVSETTFERERELCTLSVYYAEASDLERVGIRLTKEVAITPAPALPQAFSGFCKPPISR